MADDRKEKLYLLIEEVKDAAKELDRCSHRFQKQLTSRSHKKLLKASEDLDGALVALKRATDNLWAFWNGKGYTLNFPARKP